MHLKTIKVQARYRASTSKLESKRGTGKFVPEIRISGAWLNNIGFQIEAFARIEVKPEGILIVPHKKTADL